MSAAFVRFCRLGLVVLVVTCLAAASSLTKDDVIRMTKAGRSDRAILSAIQDAHANFDLTADDIAELRTAGVSDRIIDVMIATGPTQVGEAAENLEQSQTEAGSSYDSSEEQAAVPDYYQGAPVIAYPVYPMYYPAYFPVYDPFFPFFDGFFFSFEFVHVSRLVTVFPCDRAVLVVNQPFLRNRTLLSASRPVLFSTPRTSLAGRITTSPGRQLPGSNALRPSMGRGSVSSSSPRVVPRISGSHSTPAPFPRHMGMPYRSAPLTRLPHFQAPPMRGGAPPSFRAPRSLPAPRGAFPRTGGMGSFSAPRGGGGGRGRGSHR